VKAKIEGTIDELSIKNIFKILFLIFIENKLDKSEERIRFLVEPS
jgi:hypothetical protein